MSNYLGHLVTDSAATITTDEGILTVPSSHLSFTKVKDALKIGDYADAITLSDAALAVNEFGEGLVYIQDGVVYYNGHAVHNSLTKRIMAMVRDGAEVTPMLRFFKRLQANPSGRAVKELYRFLECNNLPITPAGTFLAYKNVTSDYTDRHSHTFDNSIGAVCEMPRNEVMDDPNKTCSSGLHFCSIEYLKGFWGSEGHTMVVSIDPADVVSIPVDYNNSKGRCCKYTVVAEHFGKTEDTLSYSAVYEDNDIDWDDYYGDDEYTYEE